MVRRRTPDACWSALMTYDGHVEPDGEWIERVDGPVTVRKLSVEKMDNNVYVVSCTRTGEALLVDVAARPDRLLEATEDVDLVAAVQTHGHWDHVRAWETLSQLRGWRVWGHRGDGDLFPHDCDRWLEDGDVLEVGDLRIEVLHVPGHTPGSLLYLVQGDERPHLFTGDSLFPGGVGNTFDDADAFVELLDGMTARVFDRLPDETWVYPGHGDDTTLGDERPSLSEWRERGW
jgi:glyoxylase-like metal-dependent hydrolase (beta-lactamase superfamily II)